MFKRFNNLTIQQKLTIIILFISGVALILACSSFIIYDRMTFRESMVNELITQTEILGKNSSAALVFNDQESAKETLQSLSANEHIVLAGVYDGDGKLLSEYYRDKAAQSFKFPQIHPAGQYFENDHLLVYENIVLNNENVGVAFVQSDLLALNERFNRYIVIVGIVSLISFVIASLLASVLQKFISAPIHHLAQISKEVSEKKDYSLRAKKFGEDEVGNLIDSFNDMLTRIQDRNNALLESESRFRSVTETAKEAIITTNESGKIVSWNRGASDVFGYQEDEILDHDISELIPKDQWAQQIHKIEISNQNPNPTGQEEHIEEYAGIRKGNIEFPMEMSLSTWSTHQGRFYTGIIRDITERKNMESQLMQSQKLESIGQLASGIAHEINTPAQYVSDNTRFLSDAFGDLHKLLTTYQKIYDHSKKAHKTETEQLSELESAIEENRDDMEYLSEEIPKAIEQSLDGIERVSSIVRALKDFSHPGQEKKKAIDINKALENTITVARNEWKFIADVKTDFDDNLPGVPCLPGEINQVFLNIIVNAAHSIGDVIKNSKEDKGTIKIKTSQSNNWAEIRISDTGTGIPKEIQEKIFDPFFTTKDVGSGTGQGLAITRSIVVDKHGGTINFDSTVNKGTTFIIRLPLAGEAVALEEAQVS